MSRLDRPAVARPRPRAPRISIPVVLGLGTARPRWRYAQSELAAFLARDLDPRSARRLRAAFRASGVRTRGSVLPDFGEGEPVLFRDGADPGTARRLEVYAEAAPGLGGAAARTALAAAKLPAAAITHFLWVSCTGFVSPGPDRELVARLGLSPSVRPLSIGFQGCSAGIVGLRTAGEIVRGDAAARVLVVAAELSSLHFQRNLRPGDVRGHALFADGAGAAVVAAAPAGAAAGSAGRLVLGESASRLLPGTTGEMSWTVGDRGFLMGLAATVPASVAAALPELVDSTVGDPAAIRHWAVHPGGPAVLDRVRDGLGLPEEALATSRSVLREHGNVSSATIFFVLERMAAQAEPGPGLALAFGPGLTAEALAFRA
jgi:predicted naringenin-chalcone synthase